MIKLILLERVDKRMDIENKSTQPKILEAASRMKREAEIQR